jgi:hypothetical protein
MYCEGYWGEGVCLADMRFSIDPTSRGDEIAEYVRQWYEIHRETWWQHRRGVSDRSRGIDDEFMLSFIAEVRRVTAEADLQTEKAVVSQFEVFPRESGVDNG